MSLSAAVRNNEKKYSLILGEQPFLNFNNDICYDTIYSF